MNPLIVKENRVLLVVDDFLSKLCLCQNKKTEIATKSVIALVVQLNSFAEDSKKNMRKIHFCYEIFVLGYLFQKKVEFLQLRYLRRKEKGAKMGIKNQIIP